MRRFLYRVLWFIIPISVFFISGLFSPTTPRASTSLMMASVSKDSLLEHTKSPRLILIGGSNLSFGFNGQMIKDSLQINPINTGIHASIGLQYMMKSALSHIKEGDTVILIPEYDHFYRDYNYASDALLHVVFDVDISRIRFLSFGQIISLLPYLPAYTISKLNPKEYYDVKEDMIYGVHSFDKYGDAVNHWQLKRIDFLPDGRIPDLYNPIVMQNVKDFQSDIVKKKAVFFVSFPCYQDSSYKHRTDQIKKIQQEYIHNNFKVLGTPERYKLTDSLFYNSPYHLIKPGVDYRTRLFIEDFKAARTRYK